MNHANNEPTIVMQTTPQDTPTYAIIFELDRAQQSHVSIVSSADKSHTKITLVSSEHFNTANTSALVRGLIVTTPEGLCSGAAGEWYQLGMKMPEEFFYPYLHTITDHLVPEKRPLEIPTPEVLTSNPHPPSAGEPVPSGLHVDFELNRDKPQHVKITMMNKGRYVHIALVSPTEFDANVMHHLLGQLMIITSSGVCTGYKPTWDYVGDTKLPRTYFKLYADAIIDYFTDDNDEPLNRLMAKKHINSPASTIPALTGCLSPVLQAPKPILSSFEAPKPTLDQVYQEVVSILHARGGHPAISMASSAATRKLYNHIDSITRRSLTFEENMEICRRLVREIPAAPPGYEPQRTRSKKF